MTFWKPPNARPRPVREDLKPRERRKKLEHLAYLALALLIGIIACLLLPH